MNDDGTVEREPFTTKVKKRHKPTMLSVCEERESYSTFIFCWKQLWFYLVPDVDSTKGEMGLCCFEFGVSLN